MNLHYYFAALVRPIVSQRSKAVNTPIQSFQTKKCPRVVRVRSQSGHWWISCVLLHGCRVCGVASRKAGFPPRASSSEGSYYCTVGCQRGINKWRIGPSNCLVCSLWEWPVMERIFKLSSDEAIAVQRLYYMLSQCVVQKDRSHGMFLFSTQTHVYLIHMPVAPGNHKSIDW